MSTSERRRERERAQRHRLILRTARDIAEAEGWDAVTTRRLAERIEYSQPVLYSHFAGKDALVSAIALEGFTELAQTLVAARCGAGGSGAAAVNALVRGYVGFAEANPAVYDAMFTLSVDLAFAQPTTPEPLRLAFQQLYDVLEPLAGDRDPAVLAELCWSTLHGLVTLTRGRRLRPGEQEARLKVLVDQLISAG